MLSASQAVQFLKWRLRLFLVDLTDNASVFLPVVFLRPTRGFWEDWLTVILTIFPNLLTSGELGGVTVMVRLHRLDPQLRKPDRLTTIWLDSRLVSTRPVDPWCYPGMDSRGLLNLR